MYTPSGLLASSSSPPVYFPPHFANLPRVSDIVTMRRLSQAALIQPLSRPHSANPQRSHTPNTNISSVGLASQHAAEQRPSEGKHKSSPYWVSGQLKTSLQLKQERILAPKKTLLTRPRPQSAIVRSFRSNDAISMAGGPSFATMASEGNRSAEASVLATADARYRIANEVHTSIEERGSQPKQEKRRSSAPVVKNGSSQDLDRFEYFHARRLKKTNIPNLELNASTCASTSTSKDGKGKGSSDSVCDHNANSQKIITKFEIMSRINLAEQDSDREIHENGEFLHLALAADGSNRHNYMQYPHQTQQISPLLKWLVRLSDLQRHPITAALRKQYQANLIPIGESSIKLVPRLQKWHGNDMCEEKVVVGADFKGEYMRSAQKARAPALWEVGHNKDTSHQSVSPIQTTRRVPIDEDVGVGQGSDGIPATTEERENSNNPINNLKRLWARHSEKDGSLCMTHSDDYFDLFLIEALTGITSHTYSERYQYKVTINGKKFVQPLPPHMRIEKPHIDSGQMESFITALGDAAYNRITYQAAFVRLHMVLLSYTPHNQPLMMKLYLSLAKIQLEKRHFCTPQDFRIIIYMLEDFLQFGSAVPPAGPQTVIYRELKTLASPIPSGRRDLETSRNFGVINKETITPKAPENILYPRIVRYRKESDIGVSQPSNAVVDRETGTTDEKRNTSNVPRSVGSYFMNLKRNTEAGNKLGHSDNGTYRERCLLHKDDGVTVAQKQSRAATGESNDTPHYSSRCDLLNHQQCQNNAAFAGNIGRNRHNENTTSLPKYTSRISNSRRLPFPRRHDCCMPPHDTLMDKRFMHKVTPQSNTSDQVYEILSAFFKAEVPQHIPVQHGSSLSFCPDNHQLISSTSYDRVRSPKPPELSTLSHVPTHSSLGPEISEIIRTFRKEIEDAAVMISAESFTVRVSDVSMLFPKGSLLYEYMFANCAEKVFDALKKECTILHYLPKFGED